MIGLSLNSAGSILSFAVTEDEKTLYLYEALERRDQGNSIIAKIGEGITSCGIGYPDIDFMGVVTGPGSFTGIRVGIAAVRGIAFSTKVPVIGVSSFDLFASVPDGEKINVVAVESWRTELYFDFRDQTGKNILRPLNILPHELKEYLEIHNLGKKKLVFSGDAAKKMKVFFPEASFVYEEKANAERVALLAREKIKSGAEITNPIPYYLRPADVTFSNRMQRTVV